MTDPNAQFIGSIPAAYDRYLGSLLFEPYAADLVKRLPLAGATDVLELACGTGILTQRLRQAMPPAARLTATDLNEPMLAHGQAKAREADIAWRTADAQDLPFPDGAFDLVACQFGIMFFPDKPRAMREARRVLRAGGSFGFNVWASLAENPMGRIARDTINRFFTSDPPTFYDVPFGYHDETVIGDLLTASGFEVAGCDRVSFMAHSPSALEVARGLVTGNPVLGAVTERATAPVEGVIEAVAAELAAAGGHAPLRAPMQALVVVARAA